MARSKFLSIKIKFKKIFIALAVIAVAAFILTLEPVRLKLGEIMGVDAGKIFKVADVVWPTAVALIFAMMAIATIALPGVSFLLALVALTIAVVAFRNTISS